MTFFYDLNKKLDEIRATPSTTHGQLNERDEGKPGKNFAKIAKDAGERYGSKAAGERVAGAVRNKLKAQGKLEEQNMEEGMVGDMAKKLGGMAKKVGGAVLDKLGHGSDEDMIRDLQKKAGVPQTGKKPMATPNEGVDKEKFAALAPPKDKITFADKIAGAKKEVDEMLGDVAAEAIKGALSPKQKKIDMNKNGKLDANDFAMLRKGAGKQETDEGWDDMMKDVERRRSQTKKGEITHGHKHDIEDTGQGRRVTRRVDPNTGYSVGADDDSESSGEKRGRGRPKGSKKAMGAKGPSGKSKLMTKEAGGMKQTFAILDDTLIDQIAAMNGAEVDPDAGSVETWNENTARQLAAFAKKNPQRLKQTQSINTAGMRPMAQPVGGTASGPEYNLKEEGDDVKAAMKLLKKAGYKVSKAGEEELDEKAVSKKQQRFMGMVHATQKGEKAPSKEVAKVAKTMKKSDAEDFASTKHKGLPEKKKPEAKKDSKSEAPKKKKEKTEEAGGTGTPTASSGFSFGKGIYDSMNFELEQMISEGMNVSMNMNSDANGGPSKSLTITATDDDALKLSQLLKNAGLSDGSEPSSADPVADEIRMAIDGHGDEHDEECPSCGSSDCGCEEVDEAYGDNAVSNNQPNWPTNTEKADNNFEYSGGLNKPKASGMATMPVTDVQVDGEDRFSMPAHVNEDEELARIKEMAGIREAKKVEEDDMEEGNLFTGNLAKARAAGKKQADLDGDGDMEKVDEGILSATANLWTEYKGKYGV